MTSKPSHILSIQSQAFKIIIDPVLNKDLELSSYEAVSPAKQVIRIEKDLEDKISEYSKNIRLLEKQLAQEQQVTFILKSYFHKIEKMVYTSSSTILSQDHLDYEALQLHFRQLLRRLQDLTNKRITAPPKIYKKSNVKVYRIITEQDSPS